MRKKTNNRLFQLKFNTEPLSFFSPSKVRESVINRFLIAKHHFVLSDVVLEEEVPTIGYLCTCHNEIIWSFSNLEYENDGFKMHLGTPSRNLSPQSASYMNSFNILMKLFQSILLHFLSLILPEATDFLSLSHGIIQLHMLSFGMDDVAAL